MTSLRICSLIVAIETRRYILSVANAVEREIFDHQTRDDLGLARDLQRSLLREQLLLTDEECEELDLLPVECVMYVAQPFILVVW